MAKNFFPDDEPPTATSAPPPTDEAMDFSPDLENPTLTSAKVTPAKEKKNYFPDFDKTDEPTYATTAMALPVGANRGIANTLGTPVDAINSAIGNLSYFIPGRDKPVSAEMPIGGSESIKKGMGLIGANPDTHLPRSNTEKYLQAGGEGIGSMVGGEFAAAPLLSRLATTAPRTAEALGNVFGTGKSATATGTNMIVGGVGSVAGEGAAELVPEKYKGVARSLGSMAGGLPVAGAAVGARAAKDAIAPKVGEFLEPFTKAGQEAAASRQFKELFANPGEAADTLQQAKDFRDTVAPGRAMGEIVPGSRPTTPQLAADPKALAFEREMATASPEKFNENEFGTGASQQNEARVRALTGIEPNGRPEEVSGLLNRGLAAIDAQHEAAVNAATTAARTHAWGIGQGQTPEAVGNTLRNHLLDAQNASEANENALWRAVDPENRLALTASRVSQEAHNIARANEPTAKPIGGEEAAILDTAQNLDPVIPFNHMVALRKRINAEMRAQKDSDPVAYGRLSRLQNQVTDSINNAAEHQAAQEQAAVARGEIAPEQTMESRLRQAWGVPDEQVQPGRQRSNAPTASAGAGAGTRRPAGEGAPLPTSSAGANSQAGRGLPTPASDQGIPPKASLTNEVPNVQGTTGGTAGAGTPVNPTKYTDIDPRQYNSLLGKSAPANNDRTPSYQRALDEHDSIMARWDAAHQAVRDAERVIGRGMGSEFELAQAYKTLNKAHQEIVALEPRMHEPDPYYEPTTRENLQNVIPQRIDKYFSSEGSQNSGAAPSPNNQSQPLVHNFDEAAAGRLSAANAATKEQKQTFGQGPVSEVLATRGTRDNFRVNEGSVPGKLLKKGPEGFAASEAYHRAVNGDPAAMQAFHDAAAEDLRRRAMDANGVIDVQKFNDWAAQHADMLRTLPPSLRQRFQSAAAATQAVADAALARRQATQAYQDGIVGKVLGVSDPRDVTKTIGGILGQKDAVQQMTRLAGAIGNNTDGVAGLRRAVMDSLIAKSRSATTVGASGIEGIQPAVFKRLIADNAPVLRAAGFSNREVGALQAIAADITRSQQTLSATKLPGQSNTATDLLAHMKREGQPRESFLNKAWKAMVAGKEGAGTLGALGGLGTVAGHSLVGKFRDAGLTSIRNVLEEGIRNPELGLKLLQPSPKAAGTGSDITMGKLLGRMSQFSAQKYASPTPNVQTRASGGRVNTRDYPAKKASALEKQANRIRKAYGGELNPLLHMDDNVVARALRLAHH